MKAEVYVITSGKGGVGKTTATSNIGTALALRGKKVLLLDADIGLRNLDVIMGLENRIVYDLVQAIEGVCKPRQAMIKDKTTPELYLIPAAQTRDKNAINGEQMKALCDSLRPEFDYILIDCPAGIEQGFRNALAPANKAIVITTPEVSAVRDADRVIGLIESAGLPAPRLVLNRVRLKMVKRGDMMSPEDVLSLLSVELLGLVPEDEGVVVSANRGIPLAHDPRSRAGEAYRRIAARVDGQPVAFVDTEVPDGIWGKLRRLVGLGAKSGGEWPVGSPEKGL